jgi:alpha-beta hydrolase superfamily lysophospholipase
MEPMTVTDSGSRASAPSLSKYQGNLQPKGFPPLPEGFISETETIVGVKPELKLFGVHHHPAKPEPGRRKHRLLYIIHGYGEHGGRYLHLPHYLKDTYDSFYCLDLRGHGRSEGLRGHVDRYDEYAEDVGVGIRHVYERFRNHPGGFEIDLLGHSMGGLVVLRVAHLLPDLPVTNLLVSAPLLGIAVQVSAAKIAAARLFSKVWGTLHMTNEIDARLLSRDPEVAIAYRADRLVSSKGTPRWYTELLGAMDDTMSRHDGIQWPMLLMVPLEDRIVDKQRSLTYFEGLKHPNKTLITYPGYYHEIFNDIGKEKVFQDLSNWVKKWTTA